ncbi:MAG: tetratricopeptide repeat protein [Cyanobacteria bacterium P01_H01_bin.21]
MNQSIGLIPPGKTTLSNLGIDAAGLKHRDIPCSQRAHYRAITNWLTKYDLSIAKTNKERLQGILEAFHHFCALEEWRNAAYLLYMPLNTPPREEVHNQLFTWGYYRDVIGLYEQLLAKGSEMLDSVLLNGMGASYDVLGHYDRAIECYQKCLKIAQNLEHPMIQAEAFCNLGNVFNSQGYYGQAVDHYNKYLAIAREVQSLENE